MILGALAFFLLSDTFANAKWLTDQERDVLTADHAEDLANKPKTATDSLLAVFQNPAIWRLRPGVLLHPERRVRDQLLAAVDHQEPGFRR